jgi:hypothetical protein
MEDAPLRRLTGNDCPIITDNTRRQAVARELSDPRGKSKTAFHRRRNARVRGLKTLNAVGVVHSFFKILVFRGARSSPVRG